MNLNIRQRIEQIKKGEIPDGYRYTRAGICPSDWRKGVLSDVLYNEQRAVKKPEEAYWRLGIRSHAKGTFHEFVEDPETVDMDELYVVRENDLVVNITFAWEHAVALADKNDDGLLVSHRFPTYVFKEGQNPIFYKSVVIQKRFKELLALISPGGAGRNRVMSKKDFLRLPCNIPPLAEQTKIAEILMQCDKVIELKQKLIDEKQKLKKVLLRKMFPQKGEKVPEIRFPGFTDAWEQRKLEDVVGVYDGTHQTPNYQDHGVMFVSVEDIQTLASEKYISEEDYEKNYSVVPEQGDILMTRIGDIGTANIVKSAEPLAYYVSLALLKNKGVNAEFLRANISAPMFQNELWLRTLHTAYPKKINKDEIGKCMISIAPSNEEQEQIGAFFEGLDNLITLHQRELQEWQNKKKALMQLLLTGIVRVNI